MNRYKYYSLSLALHIALLIESPTLKIIAVSVQIHVPLKIVKYINIFKYQGWILVTLMGFKFANVCTYIFMGFVIVPREQYPSRLC